MSLSSIVAATWRRVSPFFVLWMQSGLRFRMVRSVFKFDDSTALKGSDLNMTAGFINRKVFFFLVSVLILSINIILSGFKKKIENSMPMMYYIVLIRYYSYYLALHRSDLSAWAAPLDPRDRTT